MNKPTVFWSENAKLDLKEIYFELKSKYSKVTALKVRDELFNSANNIVFAEQFQFDEYRIDCRRIVVRNFKILYQIKDDSVFIVRIFNAFQNPLKSLK
ncbi:type II toxin-antitoxin system RelE/ParE family toxin [Flavobacterium ginsenosidimutans]|uniref:Type II toxin-antitoxin system RelE/ParE family toxin n=1 Tax=Flavobacterium ginsenosidimutans TaxID=687844 RepID=A0ABZ2QCC6_9FLAO|nr:type II toxin-antitoxin system RelE/ParE family toxin [Flavobacterium ginsenosidimutans]KAF2334781.1 type II toxin-antitoxin system RelE/ParE family toxin [Flavobacterium ginsenosidimutans]